MHRRNALTSMLQKSSGSPKAFRDSGQSRKKAPDLGSNHEPLVGSPNLESMHASSQNEGPYFEPHPNKKETSTGPNLRPCLSLRHTK